ncbi:hypothetical protein [Mycolicibacterium helvum]|uniref:Uncharacterized protein n=1 Tax=Mycolicibacterium helvum TaxID=1534349 RepID=A0A7I7SZX8_9MYCO|nr:hypothetical protein [Mycolicibacterium helvum]BBY62624.1 hypothetical protein MHEL_08670 [Mycolicibacterium helvum]
MTVSTRSYLTAGVAAMVVGAITLVPIQPSAPASITTDTVRLSAAVQPLVNQVDTAAAVLGQASPAAAVQQPHTQAAAQANNNASNAIDAAYNVIMYWANYWANDLGPYLLGWIPLGYLISDQIQIWYNNFTVPVANSFVYDFLDPVVNDFWNPSVWGNGLRALANTTGTALGQTINAEINYIVTLQWFPIPLPPLPGSAAAAARVPAAAASADQAAPAKAAATTGTGHSARLQVVTQSAGTLTAEAVTDTAVTTVTTPSASKSAKADNTSATSGKSGAAKSQGDTGKKQGTAGSARSHGPTADKAAK